VKSNVRLTPVLVALLLMFSLICSFSPRPSAQANVELGPGTVFFSTSYNSTVSWSSTIYANSVAYSSRYVSFTEASFNSTDSPSQTFAISAQNGNATINAITSTDVGFNTTSASGKTLFLHFSTSYTGEPVEVNITQGSSQTIISPSEYLTDYSTFQSSNDAVYWNSSQQYVMVSDTSSTITLEFSSATTTTTTTITETTTLPTTTTKTTSTTSTVRTTTTQTSSTVKTSTISSAICFDPIVTVTETSTITKTATITLTTTSTYFTTITSTEITTVTSTSSTTECGTIEGSSGVGVGSSGQISAPFIKNSPIVVSSAGGTFRTDLEIINNESSVQASLTSLSFSSQIASVSYEQNSLPLEIAAGQTKTFPLNITVPANTTPGTYRLDGTAQFSEASVSVSSTYTVNFVIQITVSSRTQSFDFLQWLRSFYQWIAVIVVALIMIGLVAYSRREG
jgi:hypothetical protein